MLFPTFFFTNRFTHLPVELLMSSSTSSPRDVGSLKEPPRVGPILKGRIAVASKGRLPPRVPLLEFCRIVGLPEPCTGPTFIFLFVEDPEIERSTMDPQCLGGSARCSTRQSTKANKSCADGSHPFPRSTGDYVTEGRIVIFNCIIHCWNDNIRNLGVDIRI
jgi:hypothetical protein